jgi:two-component system, OmpR family, alkaline phosphatase synthesis response regulator PhoP
LEKSNRKVLVIDDEAPIRRIVALKLKNSGYQVLTATNGEEGLSLIRSEKPDVVISDIQMPKLDGKDLCKITNTLKATRPFLTIIMTCSIGNMELEWINQMSDTVFMEKPFSPMRLTERIDRYFESRS